MRVFAADRKPIIMAKQVMFPVKLPNENAAPFLCSQITPNSGCCLRIKKVKTELNNHCGKCNINETLGFVEG
jgi:hypothetical protein